MSWLLHFLGGAAAGFACLWIGFRAGHQQSDRSWAKLGQEAAKLKEAQWRAARHAEHQARRKRGVRPPC